MMRAKPYIGDGDIAGGGIARDNRDGAVRSVDVEQLDAAPTPAELAVPWRKLVYPFRMREPRVTVHKNIAYDDGTGRRGLLDVYVPADTPPQGAPVLLQVHGGGWTIGNKDQQGIPLMQHLAAKGWVCVAINYRLSPKHAFPAHVIDVKKAIVTLAEGSMIDITEGVS